MKGRETIINNYIHGYNQFDTDKMIADFDENFIFENIQKGKINIFLN